jgi:hypothetical protein
MKRDELILTPNEFNEFNFENRIVNIAFFPMTDNDVIDNTHILTKLTSVIEDALFDEDEKKDIEMHGQDVGYLNEKYGDKIKKASEIINQVLSVLHDKDFKCIQTKKITFPIIVGKKAIGGSNECYFINRKNNGEMSGWLVLKDFVHNRFVIHSPIPRWFLVIISNSIDELKKLNENIELEKLYVVDKMEELEDGNIKIERIYPYID